MSKAPEAKFHNFIAALNVEQSGKMSGSVPVMIAVQIVMQRLNLIRVKTFNNSGGY